MGISSTSNPLLSQILDDCTLMVKHGIDTGKALDHEIIQKVELYKNWQGDPAVEKDIYLDLINVYNKLLKAVSPGTPESLRFFDKEENKKTFFGFISKIGFIRQLVMASIICLVALMLLSMSEHVSFNLNSQALEGNGLPILANLLFLAAAAGLGASIKELFEAHKYTTTRTFHPKYKSTYWTRFTLGIVAGMSLAALLPISDYSDFFAKLSRSTVALIGGFSASLVYKFLNRLVESGEQLLGHKTDETKEAQKEAEKAKKDAKVKGAKLAGYLSSIRELLVDGADPYTVKEKLSEYMEKLLMDKEPETTAVNSPKVLDEEFSEDEEKYRSNEYQLHVEGPIEKSTANPQTKENPPKNIAG